MSFSQSSLGETYNCVYDRQMKDDYVLNFKTVFSKDSIVLHCYYDGYNQTYVFDSKTKKVIGEMTMTSGSELATFLCAIHNSKCIKETEDSWIYTYNGKTVEVIYSAKDIDNITYHIFFAIYKQ